ncbi:hypothetical protein GGS23DRAFT_78885 [Durotheca rogersii]|uniref:uncharacterized protein n=1 Tax=Durotheca rogersii TaxID=419775 RepID=UPI00221ED6B1|nr:uncharacterized protein GGS23DRAFT_78885 [Durotheca rogersii]KAI5862499.1 hypothetical protein GGS23DRAFT_78885 [Durotheca rogersii]
MQFANIFVVLSMAVAAFAAPAAEPVAAPEPEALAEIEARAVNFKVAWGQQLQNHDQANHWVVWVEGESACPAAIELAALTRSPCGRRFNFKGQTLSLGDCADNKPRSLLNSSGKKVKSCGANGKKNRKINCKGSQHDIVQHGFCK